MLANDQIKELARRIGQEARSRAGNHTGGERRARMSEDEREPLWEAAARASNVIAEIAALDEDEELGHSERGRRASYLESELEIALDAIKVARRALKWRGSPELE